MLAHQPIMPAKAIELVRSRKLERADALLADFAAAGLIKTYALVREIKPAGAPTETVRDAQVPPDEWERIIASDKTGVALNGGTVRLEGSPLHGGLPSVSITGISFSESSLVKVLDRYCANSPTSVSEKSPTPSSAVGIKEPLASSQCRASSDCDVLPIKPGDLTVSVAQAIQATGLGRTTIDKLMREGKLERIKVGGRTLITVESIKRLVGATRAP